MVASADEAATGGNEAARAAPDAAVRMDNRHEVRSRTAFPASVMVSGVQLWM